MQPYRNRNNNIISYPKSFKKIINMHTIHELYDFKNISDYEALLYTKDKLCTCGHNYMVLFPSGDSFRCFPTSRAKKVNNYLGNILENNFSFYSQPLICEEKSCYCFEKYNFLI